MRTGALAHLGEAPVEVVARGRVAEPAAAAEDVVDVLEVSWRARHEDVGVQAESRLGRHGEEEGGELILLAARAEVRARGRRWGLGCGGGLGGFRLLGSGRPLERRGDYARLWLRRHIGRGPSAGESPVLLIP